MSENKSSNDKTQKKSQSGTQIKKKSVNPNAISETDRNKIAVIAGRAKKMRIEMGVGYEQFALQAGINRNSYYRFERATKTGENFTIALLLKVIKGLNISISEFFNGIE